MYATAMERDFSNFYFEDNVYQLAGELVPHIADRLRVPIGDEPDSADLQRIVDQVGPRKELRTNPELELDRDEVADLVESSKIQAPPLRRSLWTPDEPLDSGSVDYIVAMGGVANWQDRTADLIANQLPTWAPVCYLAGKRIMKLATELVNPNVQEVIRDFGTAPSEAEYAASVIAPSLKEADVKVRVTSFDTGDGDTMIASMFRRQPELLGKKFAAARVANAGILFALQLRDNARKVQRELVEAGDISADQPLFDADRDNPQVYIATDNFPDIARTDEQDDDPAHFQKAAPALRQLLLTAKKLRDAQVAQA